MKKTLVLSAVLALSLAPALSHADTFKGSILRGELIFLNDPALFDPALGDPTNLITGGTGFTGTRSLVGAGKEYSYDDGVATYSLNTNDTSIIVRVKCDAGVSLAECNTEPGFIWLLKDDFFESSTFLLDPTSNLFIDGEPGPIASEILLLNPLSLDPCGCEDLTLKNSRTIIDVIPNPTPEPGSLTLLGTGVLGILGTARRRFRK